MSIAGFDPSITHFGWVIFDENKGEVLKTGVFKTSPTDGLLVQRLIMQRERVRDLIEKNNINFVCMEAPYWQDFSTELLFALNQYIHEVFLNNKIFVVYIQPAVLKKSACPGLPLDEISKHAVTHQAKQELGLIGKRFSEHIADAYFVGKIGIRFYQWYLLKKLADIDLTEMEQKLFCGKHTFTRGDKKGITEYTGIIYRENEQFFDYRKPLKDSKTLTEEVLQCL